MPDTKILTNEHFGWLVGPSTAVPAANWTSGPTLAQLQTLLNISEAVRIDGTDFGLEASGQAEDRSFVDPAGAQSRAYNSASGSVEIWAPARNDTTSIYAQAWGALATPRSHVVLAQRPVASSTTPVVAGDEVWLFDVMTDGGAYQRNDVSRTLSIEFLSQGNILAGYIVPASPAAALTVAGGGALTTAAVGTPAFLKVAYQGRPITNKATFVSSDETVVRVRNGVVIPVAAGTATITISYPGAAPLTPLPVTVS